MGTYQVIMRVEITRVVEADSEKEAIEKADNNDMMYELKNYGVDEEFFATKICD